MKTLLRRREALLLTLAGLGLTLAPETLWAAAEAATHARDQTLDTVCDLVIPPTDTPGALAVGVPDFVLLCLTHADGETMQGDEWQRVARQLTAANFLAQDTAGRRALLTQIDKTAFATRSPDLQGKAWRAVKSLIVTGYYTSEQGGAHELHYDLVPGRFDPDVAVIPGYAELSNDWVAVNFR